MEKKKENKFKETAKKFGISFEKLEKEQEKLGKSISLKDSIDFSVVERVAGIDNVFFGNKIISEAVVFYQGELEEQVFFDSKANFPYLPGYRAYRELPSMVKALSKLEEKPDIVFVKGHGVLHPRKCGLATHFSLATGIPVIGIADSLVVGEEKEGSIYLNGKIVGEAIQTKKGAKKLYISPGNGISVTTAVEMVKKFTKEKHKLPEPLRLAKRFAKKTGRELFKQ